MKYIVHKRYKGMAICGEVNLPAGTACECVNGVISYDGGELCFVKSENAHQHFAVDEDGLGMVRGRLTQAIQKKLAVRDDDYQTRWDKIWGDPVCQDYKRVDHEDHWLWNQNFFDADVYVLRHIARLVGAKEKA